MPELNSACGLSVYVRSRLNTFYSVTGWVCFVTVYLLCVLLALQHIVALLNGCAQLEGEEMVFIVQKINRKFTSHGGLHWRGYLCKVSRKKKKKKNIMVPKYSSCLEAVVAQNKVKFHKPVPYLLRM